MKTLFDRFDKVVIEFLQNDDDSTEKVNKELIKLYNSKEFSNLNFVEKGIFAKYTTDIVSLIVFDDTKTLTTVLGKKYPKDLNFMDYKKRLKCIKKFFKDYPNLFKNENELTFIYEQLKICLFDTPQEKDKDVQLLTDMIKKVYEANPELISSLGWGNSSNGNICQLFINQELEEEEITILHNMSIQGLNTLLQIKSKSDPHFPEKNYYLKDIQYLEEHPKAIVLLPNCLNPEDDVDKPLVLAVSPPPAGRG